MKKLFTGFSILLLNINLCFATPIKIGLDWLVNPLHLLLVVGIENGAFQKADLDVQLVPFTSYSEATRQLMAGTVNLIIMDESRFHFYAKKHPLVNIHTLIHQPIEVMVSHKPMSALKGSTIAHQSSGIGLTLEKLSNALAKNGLPLNDVTVIMAKQNLNQIFIHHQVDAAMNIMKPFGLYAIKQHVPNLYEIDLGDTAAGQLLIGKSDSTLNLKALSSAIENVRAWVLDHPTEAITLFKKKYPELASLFNDLTEKELIELFRGK